MYVNPQTANIRKLPPTVCSDPQQPRGIDFPKIRIISLRQATERRERVAAQLNRLGLAFEFLDAVEASTLTPANSTLYNGRKRRILAGKDLYPGELACLLSHKKVLEEVATDNQPWIILEDDALISIDWPEIVRRLLAIPQTWELVRFFGDLKHETRKQRKLLPLGGPYWLTRLATTPGEAHAYLISPSGARKLLACLHSVAEPIDMLMGRPWQTGLDPLSVLPGLVSQDKRLESDIGDIRFEKKVQVHGVERVAHAIVKPSIHFIRNILKRSFYYYYFVPDYLRKKEYSKQKSVP